MTPMAWSIGSKLSIGETTRTENTTTPKPIFKILQKKWPPVPGLSSRVETAGWKIVRRPGFEVGTGSHEISAGREAFCGKATDALGTSAGKNKQTETFASERDHG